MAVIIGALPVNLLNGTTADAVQVMSDFNFIVSQVNANGLARANNLSDVTSAATARANLGLGAAALLSSTGLLNVRYFTTPGSSVYAPSAGTVRVRVRVVGGGGGGGGTQVCTSTQNAFGASGGGGGYAEAFLTSGFSGVTITVGAGGAGGVAGFNAGATGGTSSFGAAVVATGGAGAVPGGAGAVPQTTTPTLGGTGTAGSLMATGGQSMAWNFTSALNGFFEQGAPGASIWGQPITGRTSAGAGSSPGTYGCGGQGAVGFTSDAAHAGGAGTQGFVMVEEYSQ